jgi:hypothetical protein
VLKADNLTAICEPTSRECGSLDDEQFYRPPRPITAVYLPSDHPYSSTYGVKPPASCLIWRKLNNSSIPRHGHITVMPASGMQ